MKPCDNPAYWQKFKDNPEYFRQVQTQIGNIVSYFGTHKNDYPILDCYCEAGAMVHILADAGFPVAGYEPCLQARSLWDYPHLFIGEEDYKIPCEDASIPVVTMFKTWERVEDKERFIREMIRVSAQYLVVQFLDKHDPEKFKEWLPKFLNNGVFLQHYQPQTCIAFFRKELT